MLNNDKQIFLVLVPHKDVRSQLQKYSDKLFKTTARSVYNFPWVAPLAALSRSLNTDELKHLARSLREITAGEKIRSECTQTVVFPAGKKEMTLFGPRLDLDNLKFLTLRHKEHEGKYEIDNYSSKIKSIFSPIITGIFLTQKDIEQQLHDTDTSSCGSWLKNNDLPMPPKLSFRAAALSNMYWQPFKTDAQSGGAIGYKWKIGELHWLPMVKKEK